jgi:hypothetical protein
MVRDFDAGRVSKDIGGSLPDRIALSVHPKKSYSYFYRAVHGLAGGIFLKV